MKERLWSARALMGGERYAWGGGEEGKARGEGREGEIGHQAHQLTLVKSQEPLLPNRRRSYIPWSFKLSLRSSLSSSLDRVPIRIETPKEVSLR